MSRSARNGLQSRWPSSIVPLNRSSPLHAHIPHPISIVGSRTFSVLLAIVSSSLPPRAVSHLIIINLFECGVSTHCNIMLPELEINGSLLSLSPFLFLYSCPLLRSSSFSSYSSPCCFCHISAVGFTWCSFPLLVPVLGVFSVHFITLITSCNIPVSDLIVHILLLFHKESAVKREN